MNELAFVAALFSSVITSALIGAVIGRTRGEDVVGLLLGLLLGSLGWLIIFFVEDRRPKCPHCLSVIPEEAQRCCHCAGQIVWSATVTEKPSLDSLPSHPIPMPEPTSSVQKENPIEDYKDWKRAKGIA